MESTTATRPNVLTELREEGIELSDRDENLVLVTAVRAGALAVAEVIEAISDSGEIEDVPESVLESIEQIASNYMFKQMVSAIIREHLADN